MRTTTIALIGALAATPAIDSKAVEAFDAIIAAHAHDDIKGEARVMTFYRLLNELEKDKAAAIADTCKESAK